MQNNQKKIIKILSIILILIIIIFSIINEVNNFKKKQIFIQYINEASSLLSNKLNNKNISGDASFEISVDTDLSDKIIIKPTKYNANYQIDMENRYANIDLIGEYEDGTLENNIYISNNNLYILMNDIYDKYITYPIGNLDIINNSNDYNNFIVTLVDVLGENLKTGYFKNDKVKLNGKKVDEITLDLSGKNYRNILNKTKKILRHNDEFVNSAYKLFGYYGDDFDEFLNVIDIDSYKLSLYITTDTKEFIGFKVDSDEIDINFIYKKDKYIYEYYLRDGLIYNGHIEYNDNMIKSFSLNDSLNHFRVNIKFNNINNNYNKEIDNSKNIDKSINYSEIDENQKDIILKNAIINNIYNKYNDRFPSDSNEINPTETPDPIDPNPDI